MEVVTSIIGSAVIEAGKFLFGSYPNIKNCISFKSNINALEKEMKSLLDLRNIVEEDVSSSYTQTTQWLGEVEHIMLEVNSVQAGMTANNQKLCGYFFDCSKRYGLSKEIARMLEDVERLVKEGDIVAKMVGRNYLATAVEHIPAPSFENRTTTSKILAKVMDLLNDNDVQRIGVWGMGGVSKTTLVKNLNYKLKDSSSTLPFGVVIWATVSQKQDLRKVQMQIEKRLNLEMKVEESEESIAKRLRWRLL